MNPRSAVFDFGLAHPVTRFAWSRLLPTTPGPRVTDTASVAIPDPVVHANAVALLRCAASRVGHLSIRPIMFANHGIHSRDDVSCAAPRLGTCTRSATRRSRSMSRSSWWLAGPREFGPVLRQSVDFYGRVRMRPRSTQIQSMVIEADAPGPCERHPRDHR